MNRQVSQQLNSRGSDPSIAACLIDLTRPFFYFGLAGIVIVDDLSFILNLLIKNVFVNVLLPF
jgi:hypothetical protein